MDRPWRWLCALAALGSGVVCAQDQPGIDRPGAAKRLVRRFDFNAREKYALPQYWELAQDGGTPRPGFPAFNGAEHDLETAFEGQGSVRLFTKGGSTCLRLQPGVIPVFPQTEYIVSGQVHTKDLHHARAVMIARFLDRANAPIAGSEVTSDLVVTSGGEWRTVSCVLPGLYENAAYVQVDLEILQPEQFRVPQLAEHQVWPSDYSGQVWFDDVSVVQLPRVEMGTNDPTNIIQLPVRPAIDVSLRDLTGEALTGTMTLQDAAGQIVDRSTMRLSGGTDRWKWEPKINRLGWYRAELELTTDRGRVGGTHVDFIWLPDDRERAKTVPSADRSRFWVILDDLPAASRDALPAMLGRLGTGSVAFPVWSREQTPESLAKLSKDLLPTVTGLKGEWQQVSFILPRVPDELAEREHIQPDQVLSVLAMDQKVWSPLLLPLLDRYGQMVQRWQVGKTGDPAPRLSSAASLGRFESALAKLVPGPVVALPWPAEYSPNASGAHEILASLPYATPAEGIADLVSSWNASLKGGAVMVALEPLPKGQYSRREAAIHLAEQAVAVWAACMPAKAAPDAVRGSLALVQPWDWPTEFRRQPSPEPESAVFANLARRLCDRRVVGKLPVAPGIECYILSPAPGAPGRTGALVAWSRGADPARAAIDAYLGDGAVTAIDLWGNATPVPLARGSGPAPATHRIALSDEPLFIENVDVGLVQFIASFHLDPDFAPAAASEHELALVLSNPFESRAQGRITILEPGGLSRDGVARDRSWKISPRSCPFSIAPGQTARIPITMSFSPVEEAGPKPFIAEVELAADRDYGAFRVSSAFEVRLDEIQLDLSYRVIPGTNDLVVEAHLTNKGKAAATIELAAFAERFPRARASIADLPPGETATRRFAFPNAASGLRGRSIVVAAQDADSQSRVNRSVQIE